MATKKKEHYVSNKDFLNALIEYKLTKESAIENNLPIPRIPEYIGECFLKIAQNVAHKPNFSGYSYKDEMIGDAVLNCVAYIDNFNPEKSKNPFAYFTQFTYYAFLRRIEEEKHERVIKAKLISKIDFATFDTMFSEDAKKYKNTLVEFLSEDVDQIIADFEAKKKKKKEKKVGIEKFME